MNSNDEIDDPINFPFEALSENASAKLAFGPLGNVAFASGSVIKFSYVTNHHQIKQSYSIKVGASIITALHFSPSEPQIYIGDENGNIFIFDYQNRRFLYKYNVSKSDNKVIDNRINTASFVPENKNDFYFNSVNQIEYLNGHLFVLFNSKENKSVKKQSNSKNKLIGNFKEKNVSINNKTKENKQSNDEEFFGSLKLKRKTNNSFDKFDLKSLNNNEKVNSTNLENNFHDNDKMYDKTAKIACFLIVKDQNNIISFDLLNETNVFEESTNFSIDTISYKHIFIFAKHFNYFSVINLSSLINNDKAKSLPKDKIKYDDEIRIKGQKIQKAEFSFHLQDFAFILTEHFLFLYNCESKSFSILADFKGISNVYMDSFVQFPTDHQKLLLVYKTGTMKLFKLETNKQIILNNNNNNNNNNNENTNSVNNNVIEYKPLDDNTLNNEIKNTTYQTLHFVDCALSYYRDDFLVIFYHPFGFALLDLMRMKIVSCCPIFTDKTTSFATNEKYVCFGTSQGNIRVRPIFDSCDKSLSIHALDKPITFINITNNYINNINDENNNNSNKNGNYKIVFGNQEKIGVFSIDTKSMKIFPSSPIFPVLRAFGGLNGGLIVQRDRQSLGVFINGNETFLSFIFSNDDKILDVCFDEFDCFSNRGKFMVLKSDNFVHLYRYGPKTMKFDERDAKKRKIILSDKKPLCVALSNNDFTLGFDDGSVLLMKNDDETYAKSVVICNSIPLSRICFSGSKNKVLYILTKSKILCELDLETLTPRVVVANVDSFSVINEFSLIINSNNSIRLFLTKEVSQTDKENHLNNKINNRIDNEVNAENKKVDTNNKEVNNNKEINNIEINEKGDHDNSNLINKSKRDKSLFGTDKYLSLPTFDDYLREFIENNPIFHNAKDNDNYNPKNDNTFSLPTIFDGHRLTTAPSHLPYFSGEARDFWYALMGRPSLRMKLFFAAGPDSIEYERLVSYVLQNTADTGRNYYKLFYALVFAHRYDEATTTLSYRPQSKSFLMNTVLASAMLGFAEKNEREKHRKRKNITNNQNNDNNSNDNSNNENNNNDSDNRGNFSDNNILKNRNTNNNYNIEHCEACEYEYDDQCDNDDEDIHYAHFSAQIKSAAIKLIASERYTEGANLLRIAHLDLVAAQYLITSNHITFAMKFVRSSLNENDKRNSCFEIGIKFFKGQKYIEACFFFLTAKEYHIALYAFCINDKGYRMADAFFIKEYLVKRGLLKQIDPEKLKKIEALSSGCEKILPLNEMIKGIDRKFAEILRKLNISKSLYFPLKKKNISHKKEKLENYEKTDKKENLLKNENENMKKHIMDRQKEDVGDVIVSIEVNEDTYVSRDDAGRDDDDDLNDDEPEVKEKEEIVVNVSSSNERKNGQLSES